MLITVIVACSLGVADAEANWLTSLGEIAATTGEVAGKSGRLVEDLSVGLEGATQIIGRLPVEMQKGAIAAEALDGGAWRLRNAAGETITATSAEGVRGALSGVAGDSTSVTFYVGEETAFGAREPLSALPADIKLQLAIENASYPLLRQGAGVGARLFAELNGGVLLALKDRGLFGEALWQLQRPLGKSGIRVLALDSAGPKMLSAIGKRGPEGLPLAEPLDPAAFAAVLPSIRGQTIIVTGKVDGAALRFSSNSGVTSSVPVADLMAAAEQSDVNFLLLDSGALRQPGGTTWLWQERGIAHLDIAMAKATLGDFIAALSRGQERLIVDADWGVSGHFRLSVKPATADAPAASGALPPKSFGESTVAFAVELAAKIAEHVTPQATTVSLNSRDTQWDLDNRLFPGIPAGLQIVVAGSWVLGLIACYETRRWWAFLQRRLAGMTPPFSWPGRIGSEVLCWLLFAPLIGWLTFDVMVVKILWEQVMGMVRLLLWPFRRLSRT